MAHEINYIDDHDFTPDWPERIENARRVMRKKVGDKPNYYDEIASILEKTTVTIDGTSYNYYRHDTLNSKKIRYVIGGRRSLALNNTPLFKNAKDNDYSVVFLELPQASDDQDYGELQIKTVDHFLKNLPLSDHYAADQRDLVVHSAGAWALTENLKKDHHGRIPSSFSDIPLCDIFLGATIDGSLLRFVYDWQAERKADKKYGDSLFDLVYAAVQKIMGVEHPYEPEDIRGKSLPYHHENTYMRHGNGISGHLMQTGINGRRESLLSSPFPKAVMEAGNIRFVHGNNDHVADKKHAIAMAKHMGAPITIMKKTFHMPFTDERLKFIFNPVSKPQPAPRRSIARKLSQSVLRPMLNFQSMSRMRPENMATDRTPLRERLPRLRFPIGR